MAKALVDLINKNYSSRVILDTFRDYAKGASITLDSIKTIVDKSHLTKTELDTAYNHLQRGMVNQIICGNGIDGLTYFQSMNYIAKMIAETISTQDSISSQSAKPLTTIKSELIKAHSYKSKANLDNAVKAFQNYVLQINPNDFEEGASIVNLTQPHQGIYAKTYNLSRYGGSISVHKYLMGIHATNDLQIAEAPARN
ncbi:MAG: hypothetical protein ACP5N1_04795 [Candidatus Woesearchaeota archaeon]